MFLPVLDGSVYLGRNSLECGLYDTGFVSRQGSAVSVNQNIQTACRYHQASYAVRVGGLPGGKAAGRLASV